MILKITMPSNSSVCDGKQITFRAPCNQSDVTGLMIDNVTYSWLIGSETFITGDMVSVTIDTENKRAHILHGSRLIDHASEHKSGGSDPITPAMIGAAPAYTYGTEDLTSGESQLETGKLYFVHE